MAQVFLAQALLVQACQRKVFLAEKFQAFQVALEEGAAQAALAQQAASAQVALAHSVQILAALAPVSRSNHWHNRLFQEQTQICHHASVHRS